MYYDISSLKTFAIHTLGCKTNQMESCVIANQLNDNGLSGLKYTDSVDLYIINSCTVTSKTDKEVLYWIRKAKKTNINAKIIVTGCFAQVSSGILSEINDVNLILGNTEKLNIVQYIKYIDTDTKIFVSDIMKEKKFTNAIFSESGKTRANVKIQDGCNNRCSYCIIPFARGNSRSNSEENIISQINALNANNYKELVLTGIHLGQWGLDLTPRQTLTNLLKAIESKTDTIRYRMGSLDPKEFTPELLDFIFSSNKMCNHFHISLQSGTNKTLKNMNRAYSIEEYANLVKKLNGKIPDIAIGSDVIVGFPGETDEDFEQTYLNLSELPITYLHVFSYSIRKGTKAASMENHVDEQIKKIRANKLKTLALEKKTKFIESLIGTKQIALIELYRDKKSELLKGLTSNYLSVEVQGDDKLKNTMQKVKLIEFKDNKILGQIV